MKYESMKVRKLESTFTPSNFLTYKSKGGSTKLFLGILRFLGNRESSRLSRATIESNSWIRKLLYNRLK